ncbi:MAG: putative Na+/H+ antiporter [Acidobacteria bacterium]|nr:putative Na+/H+ antiporter [Acidobacteriota bacterium]
MPQTPVFPLPLDQYADPVNGGLLAIVTSRLAQQPANGVATAIFALAIVHTFFANSFREAAHRVQHRHDAVRRAAGLPPQASFAAEVLHFFGEVEVVFGLWAIVLLLALTVTLDWHTAHDYVAHRVTYTEPMFVVVIMAMAATRPVVEFARRVLSTVASIGGRTPAAWWFAILSIGPLLGSFITEPAAMTICALLLSRQFYSLQPSQRLRYATIGLLFVNVSIGGTLTHFAAPPVLMVAAPWDWSMSFMATHFGWRAVLAILVSTTLYFAAFRRELRDLALATALTTADDDDTLPPTPWWVTAVHLVFLAFVVTQAHYPVLFIGAFLFFLGFTRATSPYQSPMDLRSPLLVGFFLAGLVTHGGLQGWWIAPALNGLSEQPLFWTATILTAFNDNALITYLATLVPNLNDTLKFAVVAGAVTGGGLTVIANAPNPAGQAILGRHFPEGVSPLWLAAAALLPTLIAAATFMAF